MDNLQLEHKKIIIQWFNEYANHTKLVAVPYSNMEYVSLLLLNDPYVWDAIGRYIKHGNFFTAILDKNNSYYWVMGYLTGQAEIKYQAGH